MTKRREAPERGKGGGSRAAKKRAKKRDKQKAQMTISDADDPEQKYIAHTHNTSEDSIQKLNKKLNLPLRDDDNDNMAIIENAKVKRSCNDSEKDDIMIDSDRHDIEVEENDLDDQVLDQLAQLTPAEILFPDKYISQSTRQDKDDESSNMGEVDQSDFLNSLPTEKRANLLFKSIIEPSGLSRDSFYKHYWEKKPLVISCSKNIAEADREGRIFGEELDLDKDARKLYIHRFDGFLSEKSIKDMIKGRPMRYGIDLNVTNYCNTGSGEKRRITLDQLPDTNNLEEDDVEFITAESNDVWSNFKSGCTIRLLCPQKHNDNVHSLLSTLEHEFGCMVGSNAYLTPGGAINQGFAPHYDDIEAFILQLEGYKHWRVYEPMSKDETLPRESSRDFTDEEMKDIEPVIDIELGPGDLLYMPRGWVHQANTCKSGHHSLHLTVSAMQNWSWTDLLENIMPEALAAASASSLSLRSGLPLNFLSYMGTMYDNDITESESLKQLEGNMDDEVGEEAEEVILQKRRKKLQDAFKADAKKKIMIVCKKAISMVTSGCDQIGIRFLSDRLPPALTTNEAALTSENRAENGGKIFPNTLVRLAKPGLARLVVEGDKAVVYHSLDNSRVYHENPLSPLEYEIDDAPALEMMLTTTEPHWICVNDLLHGDIDEKMDLAQSLYDEGILAIFQSDAPDLPVQTG